MTNAQIVLGERIRLADEGIIGTTGRILVFEEPDGTKKQIEEPEQIHTFATWKSLGRSVKKGEHAKAKFQIWKQGKPKKVTNKDGEEEEKPGRMFLKYSFWFTIDQTEEIKK